MLKRACVALGLTLSLFLAGCQTHQQRAYKAECMTSVPRNQCVDITNPYSCVMERTAISACSRFVSREVDRQLAQGNFPLLPPAPRYSAPDPTPIIVEVNNDDDPSEHWNAPEDMEWRVPVDPAYAEAYWRASLKADRLVTYMLDAHQKDVRFYLRRHNNRPLIPEDTVLRRITKIEKLRAPLDKAVAAGEAMVAFYSDPANQPQEAFEVLADDLVKQINPGDPFLRKGADAAIENHRLESERSLLPDPSLHGPGKFRTLAEQARLGLETFKEAQANSRQPLTYAFEQRKAAHLVELKRSAQRNAELQRLLSRPAPEQRARGGRCSCAGGNVCYGPRGGRFCITSGGNKRYGI
ncbi:hypothetical protein [Geopseudomonas aromaticivorans]